MAALLRLEASLPGHRTQPAVPAGRLPVTVEIREPELCPRYMCGLVRGVKVAPSPPWLKARLLLAGMRPINNVVDITNYVLYEWGQPLHAFDFQKISGSQDRRPAHGRRRDARALERRGRGCAAGRPVESRSRSRRW